MNSPEDIAQEAALALAKLVKPGPALVRRVVSFRAINWLIRNGQNAKLKHQPPSIVPIDGPEARRDIYRQGPKERPAALKGYTISQVFKLAEPAEKRCLQALLKSGGHKSKAAKELGVSPSVITYALKRLRKRLTAK